MINYRFWTDRINNSNITNNNNINNNNNKKTLLSTTPRFQVHFLHPVSVDAMILESTSSQN